MTALPQDVLDAAIDELQNDLRALRTCAFVCHDWLHRSRVHLFSKVTISYPGLASEIIDYPIISDHLVQSLGDPANPALLHAAVDAARDSSAQLNDLFEDNQKLCSYVRAVTVRADKKIGREEDETQWAPPVASHLHLRRFPNLRSLRLVHFTIRSFADFIPIIQTAPTLDEFQCEHAHVVTNDTAPSEVSPVLGSHILHPRSPSLKKLSLIADNDLAAKLEHRHTVDTTSCASYGAGIFLRSGLLQSITSLMLFHASTVIGWLPIIRDLGPQLLHVGVILHDIRMGDEEVLHQYNVYPSEKDTVVRVYDALRTCTSLRTLRLCYDAEDTMSVRMVLTSSLSTITAEGLISSYFLDEAALLLAGTSNSKSNQAVTPPFPALEAIALNFITTAQSLQQCMPAIAALAGILTSGNYPAFARLVVEIQEPEMLAILFGDKEVDEAACVRKTAAVRKGLRPFEEAGIALDVTVVPRRPESF